MEIKLNKNIARKVLEVVDHGLVNGVGEPIPGKMCIEAAVCFALGLPHGDNPPCVGGAVRSFKISLNDQKWPTDKDRTKGMRKLAIAQLGSNEIDQDKFTEVLGFNCITRVLPVIVENALKEDKDNDFCKRQNKELEPLIAKLRKEKDFKTAKELSKEVWNIYAYASTSTSAYVYAYASASASAYASAYAYASASASAYAEKNRKFHLKVLNLIAECGLDALKEMKSPGVKWLSLCD